ncbi:MAG: hypothetical protein EZS28_028380, partial [Streblomastix strix]
TLTDPPSQNPLGHAGVDGDCQKDQKNWKMKIWNKEEKAKMHKEIEVMKDITRIIRQSARQSQFIHVVEPLGFFVNEDEDKAYLVMELCSGGYLRGYIKNLQKIGIGAKFNHNSCQPTSYTRHNSRGFKI